MKKRMNNRLSGLLIALITVFLGALNVNASCTYQQKANLNDEAGKIKTSYEIVERLEMKEWSDGGTGKILEEEVKIPEFVISIYNITPNMYITQTDDLTKKAKDIFYQNADDGVYTFKTTNIENIVTYTYKIYSNLDECRGDTLKSLTFKKPMFNIYSTYGVCQGLSDVPYCKQYILEDFKVTEGDLKSAIDKYMKANKINPPGSEEGNGFVDFIKDNVLYIIIGGILVLGVAGGTVYIIRKRSAL